MDRMYIVRIRIVNNDVEFDCLSQSVCLCPSVSLYLSLSLRLPDRLPVC
jgi:hypothetical protein